MTTPNIQISPFAVTNAAGAFNVTSDGLIQGTAYPDPSTRFRLRGGLLSSAETLPLWGGCGVFEDVPGGAGNPNYSLGPLVGRATALTGSKPLAGFSVFDQDYAMINSPQSPVPLAGSNSMVNYYPLGSLARIAVACDANLTSLRGSATNSNVSWDFVNQQLIAYSAPTFSSATYTSGTGVVSVTTTAAHGLVPGDTLVVSGAAATGADTSKLNGTFVLAAGTAGTTLNYVLATGLTISAITAMTLATGGILPVKLLDVQASGCMTVSYNTVTGLAVWNYNGSAAVIQI
jgi:hypothetical protein